MPATLLGALVPLWVYSILVGDVTVRAFVLDHHPSRPRATTGASASAMTSTSSDTPLLLSFRDHLHPTGTIHLVLASQSPRRKEILDMMGLAGRFTVEPSPLDETALQSQLAARPDLMTAIEYTRILADQKAHALAMQRKQDRLLVLGADTIVELDGSILEKPKHADDARRMLEALSGRRHHVHTGVAVYQVTGEQVTQVASLVDTAEVQFATIGEADIEAYIATGEPMDKAGSYGIQGIGGQFVTSIQGDFFTVMGLPMHRVSKELACALQGLLESASKTS